MGDNPTIVPPHTAYNTISHPIPSVSRSFTTRTMTTQQALITASPSAAISNAYFFSVSDLDEASSYTGLFDQYRIDCVVFRILPMQNAIGLSTNANTITVRLYCVVDYDDSTTLASEAAARAYDSCIVVPPGRECSRVFQPRQAVAAYQGSFVGFANEGGRWNDSNSPAIQHYGVKIFIPQTVALQTQLQSWTVERDYYISWRKVHG